ncbi:UNVERIFIED_CONTAM: hypothetical protein FKN15_033288 [Acipenser sinensis]
MHGGPACSPRYTLKGCTNPELIFMYQHKPRLQPSAVLAASFGSDPGSPSRLSEDFSNLFLSLCSGSVDDLQPDVRGFAAEVNKQDLFIPDVVLERTYPLINHSWQSHTAGRRSQERQGLQ